MHRLALHIIIPLLAFQVGQAQFQYDRPDYLFGYKTLFLSTGMSLHGRYFTLGYMPYRYVFEVESAYELRSPRPHFDSLQVNRNVVPPGIAGPAGPDSNISAYIGTLRGLHREKFKFIGALFEVGIGANVKTWVYKENT